MDRKSPNLELISKNPTQGDVADLEPVQEKRRRPRLSLSTEQFRLASNGKIFSVADLSVEGMAFRVLDREDMQIFPVATEISGTLNLHGEKIPVQGKVRRLGLDVVGCEFHSILPEVKAALERFLDPIGLGRELKPIPAGDAGTTWYHGPSGTDLLLWRGVDGQYHRLTLYVRGNFIQWEEGQGLTTGTTSPSDSQSEIRGVVRFETLLMQRDSCPAADKLSIAKALLISSNVPQDLKKWCLRHFEAQ